ncbi:hypothetical protein [Ideonella sp. A 288]|uniref:hypothetical protein n=1 Tax=Ideonella sp. A 288 TaxID=1962181 RepID=UPI0013033BA0|nr:hypothetical protein [Ideonella sp. A 288]
MTVGISVSYERDHLLARGMGLEHLRELLLRLARPLLRRGGYIAYSGHWEEGPENFTYDLLRLISAEQEDLSVGDCETEQSIGRLLNHSAWPHYLKLSPRIEAQWIHCCRVLRITQHMAGIAPAAQVADDQAGEGGDRARLNSAICLSSLRRLATQGMFIANPAFPTQEFIAPLSARIVLGGKTKGYSGFIPGVFEEASLALERGIPLYVLGGFGGAAEALAEALLAPARSRQDALTVAWQEAGTPELATLRTAASATDLPVGVMSTKACLDALHRRIKAARPKLASNLHTGLSNDETRELLATRDIRRAVELVLRGIKTRLGLDELPA